MTSMPSPLLRLPPLDLVRGFVAVGRRMSITLGADDMCITQSAMSKQIRALEDAIGARLLQRGHRSIAFTETGQRLFDLASEVMEDLQAFVDTMSARTKRPVTVSASSGTAGLWLLPRLAAFQALHPDIDVRITADNRLVDLSLDGVDLAIRYCPEERAPHAAEPLFMETVAPVASPSLGLHGPITAERLAGLVLIEFDEPRNRHPWLRWSEWLAARGLEPEDARGHLLFNQYDQLIQATIAGQGIALGRLELLSTAFSTGQLVRVDLGRPPIVSGHGYWLVQGTGGPREEVAVVTEWLRACAAETARALGPGRAAIALEEAEEV